MFVEARLFRRQEADAVRALAVPRLGPVILDTVAAKPYPDVYPPGGTDPWGMVSEALFIDDLDDEIAEVLVRRIEAAQRRRGPRPAPRARGRIRWLLG